MKKKDKKKGKGAEKTAAKTAKKNDQKLKKALALKGEDDVESLLAKFVEENKRKNSIIEEVVSAPSKRSSFSLSAHPDKDWLILFGGEYFNGTKTFVYNDLYFYKIKKDSWVKVTGPIEPPPRCSHQTVVLPQNGGELWVFGGEFTSQSQSQFYHFKDLWLFHLTTKKWEKVSAKGSGPSARSGHRMVGMKKKLFIFGGFRDNQCDYKYFNDVYMFDTETYMWHRIDPSGNSPSPRSGCQLLPTSEGRIYVYGGYSKEKVKKDVDQGVVHTDMFCLAPDKHDTTGLKWRWVLLKPGGTKPSIRCAFSMCIFGNDKAILFGGVDDTEEESELEGSFFNDLYLLDLQRINWHEVRLKNDKTQATKSITGNEVCSDLNQLHIESESSKKFTTDDGIFTVSISEPSSSKSCKSLLPTNDKTEIFVPPARINPGMAVKKGILYLYGGMYEDGDKQLTLNDFYSIDLNKMDEWTTIIALDDKDLEWYDSGSESGSDSESESESDSELEEEEEEMEIDS